MRRQWETEDLIDQWTLHAEDRALLGNKTGATRLGFAALLKYFQRTGRFPQHENDLPGIVITYLATQVDVDASAYLQYDWQGRTIEYHRAQIRAALGFREASVSDGETMSQWLAEHVLPHEHQEDMVPATPCWRRSAGSGTRRLPIVWSISSSSLFTALGHVRSGRWKRCMFRN